MQATFSPKELMKAVKAIKPGRLGRVGFRRFNDSIIELSYEPAPPEKMWNRPLVIPPPTLWRIAMVKAEVSADFQQFMLAKADLVDALSLHSGAEFVTVSPRIESIEFTSRDGAKSTTEHAFGCLQEYPTKFKRGVTTLVFDGKELGHYLTAAPAADPRKALNGIHLVATKRGNLRAEATNGAICVVGDVGTASKAVDVILPLVACEDMRSGGQIDISGGFARYFPGEGLLTVVRLIDEKYPVVANVWPKIDLPKVLAASEELVARLGNCRAGRVSLSSDGAGGTRVSLCDSRDADGWVDKADFKSDKTVFFNPGLLHNAFRSVGDGATLRMSSPLKPLVVTADGSRRECLVMPLRPIQVIDDDEDEMVSNAARTA